MCKNTSPKSPPPSVRVWSRHLEGSCHRGAGKRQLFSDLCSSSASADSDSLLTLLQISNYQFHNSGWLSGFIFPFPPFALLPSTCQEPMQSVYQTKTVRCHSLKKPNPSSKNKLKSRHLPGTDARQQKRLFIAELDPRGRRWRRAGD